MIDTNINMIKEPTGFLVALKLIPIERAIGKSKMIPGSEDIDQASITKLLAYHDAVVVFMGAGDIEKYEDDYKARLKERG